ncbi:hypothetical protein HX92_1936 [Mycobacterium tuberculosis]|nr:hypothetical protein BCGT_0795 [Mycobacterium tuberculosis variant bovis BCG str. ATCC 35743]AKO23987.1 hypothetical protein GS11_1061 [Mycobacterium tuberculosis variant bovis BCG]AOZ42091.1 hypothetical protein BTB1458_1085 [Mycobacterium tuberculosis]EQM16500.1 hypothetical protein GuangZ0019_4194 [Mycobacterium tuberculosis GuangZ0019]EQM16527.1 hypothetical protein FJ05194_4155 [Mycobacterium tuberculosis FJ05194]KAF3412522.1 putative 50S ribosomal protein L32 rpmF [Mycobacterium tuber
MSTTGEATAQLVGVNSAIATLVADSCPTAPPPSGRQP